jgi:hypothetical protein
LGRVGKYQNTRTDKLLRFRYEGFQGRGSPRGLPMRPRPTRSKRFIFQRSVIDENVVEFVYLGDGGSIPLSSTDACFLVGPGLTHFGSCF